VKNLLEVSKDNLRDFLIFLLSYRHGLRAGEVGLLRVSDVDLDRGKISIKREKNGNFWMNILSLQMR